MKLSQAIVLGDTLKKCSPMEWLTVDGSCGCAFGGALLAAGMTGEQYHRESTGSGYNHLLELPLVKQQWPWLTADHLDAISDMYCDVANHRATIEDVAAYVRSVEPPDTPDYKPEGDEECISEAVKAL